MNSHIETSELLSKATARPWLVDVYGRRGAKSIAPESASFELIAIVDGSRPDLIVEANAELICRAVNSFEAMREALKAAIDLLNYCDIPRGYSGKEWQELIAPIEAALADATKPSPQAHIN